MYKYNIHARNLLGLVYFETGEVVAALSEWVISKNMQPENNIAKNIVYSGSKENIKMTMIDGKILYEDGQFFLPEDPEDIYKKANKIIQRMS